MYEGESKVFQCFGNVMHNLAVLNVFAEVMDCELLSSLDTLQVLLPWFASVAGNMALESMKISTITGLNNFIHMICMSQTSTYQNIVNILAHTSIFYIGFIFI